VDGTRAHSRFGASANATFGQDEMCTLGEECSKHEVTCDFGNQLTNVLCHFRKTSLEVCTSLPEMGTARLPIYFSFYVEKGFAVRFCLLAAQARLEWPEGLCNIFANGRVTT